MTREEMIRKLAEENAIQPVESGLYRRRTDGHIMRMTRFNAFPGMLQGHGKDHGMYDAAGFDIIIDDKQNN